MGGMQRSSKYQELVCITLRHGKIKCVESHLVGLDNGPHLLEQLPTHWAERRKRVTTRTPPPLQHTRGVLGRGCQPSGTPHEVERCASLTPGRRNGDDSEAALGAAHHRLHTSPEHRRALA